MLLIASYLFTKDLLSAHLCQPLSELWGYSKDFTIWATRKSPWLVKSIPILNHTPQYNLDTSLLKYRKKQASITII